MISHYIRTAPAESGWCRASASVDHGFGAVVVAPLRYLTERGKTMMLQGRGPSVHGQFWVPVQP